MPIWILVAPLPIQSPANMLGKVVEDGPITKSLKKPELFVLKLSGLSPLSSLQCISLQLFEVKGRKYPLCLGAVEAAYVRARSGSGGWYASKPHCSLSFLPFLFFPFLFFFFLSSKPYWDDYMLSGWMHADMISKPYLTLDKQLKLFELQFYRK